MVFSGLQAFCPLRIARDFSAAVAAESLHAENQNKFKKSYMPPDQQELFFAPPSLYDITIGRFLFRDHHAQLFLVCQIKRHLVCKVQLN